MLKTRLLEFETENRSTYLEEDINYLTVFLHLKNNFNFICLYYNK